MELLSLIEDKSLWGFRKGLDKYMGNDYSHSYFRRRETEMFQGISQPLTDGFKEETYPLQVFHNYPLQASGTDNYQSLD